jgi:hypothetical protein
MIGALFVCRVVLRKDSSPDKEILSGSYSACARAVFPGWHKWCSLNNHDLWKSETGLNPALFVMINNVLEPELYHDWTPSCDYGRQALTGSRK